MRHLFAILLPCLLNLLPARAAESPLVEMITKSGSEWLIGSWGDQASKGEGVKISYAWSLEKHAVSLKIVTPDTTAEGIIYLEPGTDKIFLVSADNKGAVATGQWSQLHGNPFMSVKLKSADGGEKSLGLEHVKGEGDSMTLKIYQIDSEGKPKPDPSGELEFIRLKD